eukprot:6185821-Pleurochrysis_carterae.AAC.5
MRSLGFGKLRQTSLLESYGKNPPMFCTNARYAMYMSSQARLRERLAAKRKDWSAGEAVAVPE